MIQITQRRRVLAIGVGSFLLLGLIALYRAFFTEQVVVAPPAPTWGTETESSFATSTAIVDSFVATLSASIVPYNPADPILGTWYAVEPTKHPHIIVITRTPLEEYHIARSDGSSYIAINTAQDTLRYSLDTFFPTPWQEYHVGEDTTRLSLTTADDVSHPVLYQRH